MSEASLLTGQIISAAIEVHRILGPGLLESAYEECLCRELHRRGINFERQVDLPIDYKGYRIDSGYRLDLVVDHRVVVELKAVRQLEKIHEAQLLTYPKMTGLNLGLLLNFNVVLLKDGIKRLVNGL
jgi:GxxExxY protein